MKCPEKVAEKNTFVYSSKYKEFNNESGTFMSRGGANSMSCAIIRFGSLSLPQLYLFLFVPLCVCVYMRVSMRVHARVCAHACMFAYSKLDVGPSPCLNLCLAGLALPPNGYIELASSLTHKEREGGNK